MSSHIASQRARIEPCKPEVERTAVVLTITRSRVCEWVSIKNIHTLKVPHRQRISRVGCDMPFAGCDVL